MVAIHAVEGGDRGVALRRGHAFRQQRDDRRQRRIEAGANQAGGPAHAAIHEAGDPSRPARAGRLAHGAGTQLDGVVHGLDQARDAQCGIESQARGALQVGELLSVDRAHAGLLLPHCDAGACQPLLGNAP